MLLNEFDSNIPTIPIEAERSYGPMNIASSPFTLRIFSKSSTAAIFSIIAIINGCCDSFLYSSKCFPKRFALENPTPLLPTGGQQQN